MLSGQSFSVVRVVLLVLFSLERFYRVYFFS